MARQLRVLQVVTDRRRRGAQTFGVDLHDELDRRGHVVRTFALEDGDADDPLPLPALGARRLDPGALRMLRRALRGADVVVAHGSSTLPACASTTLGTGRPFVYRSIGDIGYWAVGPGRRARTRWGLGRAAAVVALWADAAGTLQEGFGVPRRNVHVIPNGVPAGRWPQVDAPERAAARAGLGLRPATPTLVYVGALTPEKAVDIAIEAVSRRSAVHLLVVGGGPLRGELEARATRSASGRVHFLGQTDPRQAVAAADALVLPSRSEGLPGVLIEAGLAGLPAVATDVGGVREIVVPGRTGELVTAGDSAALGRAVDQVLHDPVPYGRAARSRCLERFEITGVGELWETLLRQVAG